MVFNADVESAISARINAVAQQTYYNALASGQSQNQALEAAKFAWQQKMDEATQTGQWNGQWNMPSNELFLQQFGQWMPGGPQAGQQTLTAQQQAYQQAYDLSQMYGQYYAPGTAPGVGGGAPTPGQQTQQAQAQAYGQAATAAGLTGYFVPPGTTGQGTQTLAGQAQQFGQGLQTEQEARAAQAQQQSQAQSYLSLLASLRGPADWAKYQQVLGSTPGGMRDLVAAAMGQYTPGGGATTGVQPQAASLQSMMGDVTGQQYYGQGGGQLNMPSVYQGGQGSYGQGPYGQQGWGGERSGPSGDFNAQGQFTANAGMAQRPQQAWGSGQAQTGWGGEQSGPSGDFNAQGQFIAGQYNQRPQQAWGTGIGIGGNQPTPQQQQQGLGGGTNLPAPNQIAAQSWNNMAPSQQQMLLGMYEGQGWNKDDVLALHNQALPKYTAGGATTGSFKM